MINYSILADVPVDIKDTYESYMIDRHIPDLIETGCFASASLLRSEPGRYRARYAAYDRESLERYMTQHAERLRAHVAETFSEGIKFEREEWEILASFK